MGMRYVFVLLAVILLVSGCAAAPAMRPADARVRLLADPRVAAWYSAHSAPAVTAAMSARDARRWRRYQPAVMFDLVKEGYLVKLDSRFGPEPQKLELLMDPASGAVTFR